MGCFNCAPSQCKTYVHVLWTNKVIITVDSKVDNGGGWTVIQRRSGGSLDFDRGWESYKTGFGKHGPDDEMWFGTEYLYQMTVAVGMAVHLRFELTSSTTSDMGVVEFSDFTVSST